MEQKLTGCGRIHGPLDRLVEYQAELQSKTQAIIHAKAKAVEDLQWVKENVEKMEGILSDFQMSQQQGPRDKKLWSNELAEIEKRMAERAVEVESRLRDAAVTVSGLKDKITRLEKDYKAVRAQEAASSKDRASPACSGDSDGLRGRLAAAEAQLKGDSDLVSKLYQRVCALNNSLLEAKQKGLRSAPVFHTTAEKPMTPKDTHSASHSARQSPSRLLPRPTRDAGEASPSSPMSDAEEYETERIFHTAGKKMEAANVKIQDASSKMEAAEDQLHDATKTITLLRDRVRILTDEVKRARSESPEYVTPSDGTTSPFKTGVVSPFKPPVQGTIKLEEPNSVLVHKMEEALSQSQERCRVLNLEIGYLEKKRTAAVDSIKTLDAAIADKTNALRLAEEEVTRMRRCLKRNVSPETATTTTAAKSTAKGALGSLIKMFKKPETNYDKYMIKQQVRRL